MGMVAILFNGVTPFKHNCHYPFNRIPHEKSGEIAQAVSEKAFKNYTILYMYIAQGHGQITSGDKILIATKKF